MREPARLEPGGFDFSLNLPLALLIRVYLPTTANFSMNRPKTLIPSHN
jgi:hypothetical protein